MYIFCLMESFKNYMYILRLVKSLLIMSLLSGCGSETWFGKDKVLDMPGERVPLVARSKDLFVGENAKHISLPNSVKNTKWNGSFNQFGNHFSNLSWQVKTEPSLSISYSKPTFLVQSSTPNIDDGKLFVLSVDGTIHSYDAVSGSELWANPFFSQEENRGFFDFILDKFLVGGIKKDGDTLYATAGIAKVIALDASTGQTLWTTSFSSPIRSIPLVVDDLLILQSIDNKIYALNKSDGSSVWTHFSNFEDLSSLAVSTPLKHDKFVIAKFSNDEVVALDKFTGEELWSNGLVSQQRFGLIARANFNSNNSFHLGDHYLITSNSKGSIFKLDLQTGTIIWHKDVAATGKSWLVGDALFFISSANDLVALDVRDGSAAWILNLSKYDENGKPLTDLYVSTPAVADGYVYVLNNKGELTQVNASTGAKTNTFAISEDAYLGPIFANGHMFIVSNNGGLDVF